MGKSKPNKQDDLTPQSQINKLTGKGSRHDFKILTNSTNINKLP